MYLATSTRPDINMPVNLVTRYLNNPGEKHWIAVKRILRYIKGTASYELTLGGKEPIILTAYSDASYAEDQDSRKSTTGFLLKLGNSTISWKTRKQQTVALSTTEAEYYALSDTTKEVLYILPILKDMLVLIPMPIEIFEDNQGTIKIANNRINHDRSKHIDTKHHFILLHVNAKKIKITYCPTDLMTADILTKGLPKSSHEKHTKSMRIQEILS